MNKKDIKEKLSEGYIHFNTIIELLGKPKEHIEKTIKEYIKNIEDNEFYSVINKVISKGKKADDGFFSVFAELDILVKDVQGVFAFCFNYMPASIEIVEPAEKILDNVHFTDVVNELQAKLHEIDMVAKQNKQINTNMNQHISAIMTNFIIYSCKISPKNANILAKITGLKLEVLNPFLEGLVKKEKLKKDKDKYSVSK